jgi:hypothetical protein
VLEPDGISGPVANHHGESDRIAPVPPNDWSLFNHELKRATFLNQAGID